MGARTTTIYQAGDAGDVSWKVAERAVAPDLAPYVLGLYGYRERTPRLLYRRELPAPQTVVILQFGPPIRVYDSGQTQRAQRSPRAFVAGVDDQFTLTEFASEQRGLEIKLTPIGARLLFGVPMHELTGSVVEFEALMPEARGFVARLAECPHWDARFDLVEQLLRSKLRAPPTRTEVVRWAFDRMRARGGRVDIATLSRELGYSHKHMVSLFRDQIGLSPKLAARLLRFDRLVRELRVGPRPWVELACELGFSDQAHLVREVRRFAGLTPSALLEHLGLSASEDLER